MTMFRINDNGIDRDMTESEIAEHKIAIANAQKADAERQATIDAIKLAKESAHKKLAALGLTDAEIAALVG
jgi:hypothetical protein